MNDKKNEIQSNFLTHLIMLRQCLLRALLAVAIIFFSLLYFANDLFYLFTLPIIKHLANGNSLIATGMITPFLVPIKFTFLLSVFIAVPFILHQLWRFVAPGLYNHERKGLWLILLISTILFYLGVMFAYFIVCPLIIQFIIEFTPKNVRLMPDITHYLSFNLRLLFAFGCAFEIPVIMALLVITGITNKQWLAKNRPYFIVLAFVLGMLLTPPDVISQILLALPIWLLFELGLLLIKAIEHTAAKQTKC